MTNRPPPDDFSLEETKIMGDKLTSPNDLAEQMQYLYVRVVKAIDLPAKYGICDPYAEVRLGNYKRTTRHIEKEANPEWNQVFAFSRDSIKSNMLEVNVMDKDIIKDDFMGRVVFDLTAVPKRVPSDSPLAPEWYGLEDRTGMKVKGEIMVAVWWGSQADKLTSLNDLAEQTQYLYVRVVKAINLPAKYGICDPYAEVRLGNYKRTTRHIEKEANPEWNQVFAFSRDGIKSNMLEVNVMDKDIIKDDFMGRVVFDLTAVPKRVPSDSPLASEWYGLEDRTGMKVKGEIMVAVWWGSQADKLTSKNDLAEQTQYLYVRVVKAIDLPAKYGICDPYAEVRLGNYKGTTRHIEKEANPEWNQVFAFSRDGIKSNMLEVNVMDKDIIKDDFMGRVVFDLTAVPKRVPSDSPLAPEWYGLEDRTGMKVKGEIMVAVWWGSQADKLISPNDLAEQMQYLYVRVVKAIDLPAKYGICDPYAEVRLGNYKRTTRHIEKEANPEWNQVFAFSRDGIKSNMLEVNVMDKDIIKDDFMGRVVFDLTAVPKRVPSDSPLAPEWYGLEDRTGMKVKGEIMVAVWWGSQADKLTSKNDLAEQTQYLYVRVVKAIDLPAKYGICDPYAEVRLGNYKGRTRHIEKEANPEWNQVFAFSRDGIKLNMLEVNVMDKDIIKDDFMGRVVFDLTAVPKRVPSDSPLAPEWYGLEDRTGMKVKGEIMVAVWWGSQADKLTSTNDLAEQTQYLYVRVVKAIDLSAKYGFCDPYAEVRLGNYKGTTRHIEKEANPEWNQVFAFSRDGIKSNMLEVNVMDKDILKDDFMGRVVFDLTAIPKRVPADSPLAPEWYGLEDRTGMKVNGEIMVAVWWSTQADEVFPEAWHNNGA